MKTKKIDRQVKVFAWASFLNDLGADMINPVWPLFLTNVLGANMAILGFIDGLGDALVALSQAASGYASDRLKKRKIFIWIGYCFGGIARLGYAFSSSWKHVIPFRILDRSGKIRNAPRDAIVAELSDHKNRGKNFGILRGMDNLGATVGILASIFLFESLGYNNLFLLASFPSALAVLLVLLFVRERPPEDGKLFRGIRLSDLTPNLKKFLLLSALFSLGTFSYSFLIIYASQMGFKTTSLPLLYLLFTAIASITSIPFGKMTDHRGRKFVLMLSYLLWGILCLELIVVQNTAAIIIAFMLYGLHKGAVEPVQRAFVSELAPPEYRASVLGGFHMVTGLTALPASWIAGLLWDAVGNTAPFYFALGLTIIASALLLFVKENHHGTIR